jgi:hypothetical protein
MKIMKRINKYFVWALLLGAIALGFTSCDLDEHNPSGEGASAVFATEHNFFCKEAIRTAGSKKANKAKRYNKKSFFDTIS